MENSIELLVLCPQRDSNSGFQKYQKPLPSKPPSTFITVVMGQEGQEKPLKGFFGPLC
jgi:hypothetical protein